MGFNGHLSNRDSTLTSCPKGSYVHSNRLDNHRKLKINNGNGKHPLHYVMCFWHYVVCFCHLVLCFCHFTRIAITLSARLAVCYHIMTKASHIKTRAHHIMTKAPNILTKAHHIMTNAPHIKTKAHHTKIKAHVHHKMRKAHNNMTKAPHITKKNIPRNVKSTSYYNIMPLQDSPGVP